MDTHRTDDGTEVEVEVKTATGGGYMITHRDRTRATYTVSCSCNGHTVTTQCSYPDGTPPSPLCDCTSGYPSISC